MNECLCGHAPTSHNPATGCGVRFYTDNGPHRDKNNKRYYICHCAGYKEAA